MAKDSFIIYTKFGEQVSLLSDAQAGVLLRALIAYQSGETLPKMDGMTNIVFSIIRQQIDFDNQKYEEMCKAKSEAGKLGAEYGRLGGRPTKRVKTAKTAQGVLKTTQGLSKTAKTPDNESDNDTDNNITPIIPYEGNGEDFRGKFFETYPAFKGEKRFDDSGIDYSVLLAEFEKSRVLRGMYSFAKICGMYESIARGDFRDKDNIVGNAVYGKSPSAVADADAKAKREKWYAERRQKALGDAEKIYKRFMQDEEFAKIERRLRVIEIEWAKAEVKGDKNTLAKLEREKARLLLQKRGIIERNGLTEEDLLPKWHCSKCEDTGFVDGMPCDCYEED
jgi:hypothetical protein